MHYVAWCWTPIEGNQVCFLFVEMRAIIALLVGKKGPEKVSVDVGGKLIFTDPCGSHTQSLTTKFDNNLSTFKFFFDATGHVDNHPVPMWGCQMSPLQHASKTRRLRDLHLRTLIMLCLRFSHEALIPD